jgi:DNA-binding MarR family transcriptional regulator
MKKKPSKKPVTRAEQPFAKAKPKEPDKNKFEHEKRWSAFLLDGKPGYTPVANYFLDHYHELKPHSITHGEAMFVIHLMSFKWTEKSPYPAYKTIAEKMGVSHKQTRRFAKSLEGKNFLEREVKQNTTNKFHLRKLITALESHKRANPKKEQHEE